MKLIDILVEGTKYSNKITAVFVPECTEEDPVRPVRTLGLSCVVHTTVGGLSGFFGEVQSGLSVIL